MKKNVYTKYFRTSATIILFFVPGFVFSQVRQDWVNHYNGPANGSDAVTHIALDAAGNVYVTGISDSNNIDYVTIKYNSAGTRQWVQRYNGTANSDDIPNDIAVDGTGNVYVTGLSTGVGTGYDIETIKYNTDGVQQWEQRYNGTYNAYEAGTALVVDAAGTVYVTGTTRNSPNGTDLITICYNAAGAQQWIQTFNGPALNGFGEDYATAIALDAAGNVIVTGNVYVSANESGSDWDYATIKYNAAGTQLWASRYNGPGGSIDFSSAVTTDGTGNVYVTGWSFSVPGDTNGSTEEPSDFATIKYNAEGAPQWVQRYNGPGNANDEAYAIAADNIGNVYVTGRSYGGTTDYDFATIKYTSSGIRQWVQRYNYSGNSLEQPAAVTTDKFSNVYVTGAGTTGASFNTLDMITVKYNTTGKQQWVQYFNGSGNNEDRGLDLAVDASGNVYIAGSSMGSTTGYDFATIKYVQASPLTVHAGPDTTVYYGYSSNCVTLRAQVSGGSAPYRFSWSPGGSTPDKPQTTVCPATTTIYKLTVTDANQNTATADVTVTVTDIRCGQKWDKVVVCHNGHALCISQKAVAAHLRHGDKPGSCTTAPVITKRADKQGKAVSLKADARNFPNPFYQSTNIRYTLPFDGQTLLVVYDAYGQQTAVLVQAYQKAGDYTVTFRPQMLGNGVYYSKLVLYNKTKRVEQAWKMVYLYR